MTFEEASEFVMPLGKHKGHALDDIANSNDGLKYLDWLRGQDWVYGRTAEALAAYLDHSPIARDLETAIGDD